VVEKRSGIQGFSVSCFLLGMALLLPGRRVFIAYAGYEDLYHERLVLAHVNLTNYVIATPDFDVYTEQLDISNMDLASLRLDTLVDGLPVGVNLSQTYRFAALQALHEALLIWEGTVIAVRERAALGLAAVGGGVPLPLGVAARPLCGAPPAAAFAVAALAAAPVAAVIRGPPVREGAPGGGIWIVDVATSAHNVGDPFQLPAGALVLGTRALVMIGTDFVVLKQLPTGIDVTAYVRQRRALLADDDLAALAAEESLSFAEAVFEMTGSPTAFPAGSALVGPPSATWWLDEVVRNGLGLLARHNQWRAESWNVQHSNLASRVAAIQEEKRKAREARVVTPKPKGGGPEGGGAPAQ
jgi:hypothetical protein